jgi:hypothetical protein
VSTNGNGANGGVSTSDLDDWPGPGLWLLLVEGGVGYLARTTEPMNESDVAIELAAAGSVRLSLRPIYVLDTVRGVIPDPNRGFAPFLTPLALRLDQRLGLTDDFVLHMSARAVVFLSTLTPEVRAHLRGIVDQAESLVLRTRAARAGISLPTG